MNYRDRPQTDGENIICNQILDEFKPFIFQIKNKYEQNGTPLNIIIDGIEAGRQLCEVYIKMLEKRIQDNETIYKP